jgi:hypothetical protein
MATLPAAFNVTDFQLSPPPVLGAAVAGVAPVQSAQQPQNHSAGALFPGAVGVGVQQPPKTAVTPPTDAEVIAWTEQQKIEGEKAFYLALSADEIKLLTKAEQARWKEVTGRSLRKPGRPGRVPMTEEEKEVKRIAAMPDVRYDMCPQYFEIAILPGSVRSGSYASYVVTGTFTFPIVSVGRPRKPVLKQSTESARNGMEALKLHLESCWKIDSPTSFLLTQAQDEGVQIWEQVPAWSEMLKVTTNG